MRCLMEMQDVWFGQEDLQREQETLRWHIANLDTYSNP